MMMIIVLFLMGVMAMLADACGLGRWGRVVISLGFIGAFFASFCSFGFASSMWAFDASSLLWSRLLIGFCGVLYVLDRGDSVHYQQDALMIFSLIGAVLMTSYSHVLMLFLAIETMSIPLYVLVGTSGSERSLEASVKYFLLGSFASAVLLFGIALGYAGVQAGAVLVVIGLCFKVGLVPFHWWVPDVYEGAPA